MMGWALFLCARFLGPGSKSPLPSVSRASELDSQVPVPSPSPCSQVHILSPGSKSRTRALEPQSWTRIWVKTSTDLSVDWAGMTAALSETSADLSVD